MNFGYWQDCEAPACKFQMLCQPDRDKLPFLCVVASIIGKKRS